MSTALKANLRNSLEIQDQEDIAAIIHEIAVLRDRVGKLEWAEELSPEFAALLREIGNLQRTARDVVSG